MEILNNKMNEILLASVFFVTIEKKEGLFELITLSTCFPVF